MMPRTIHTPRMMKDGTLRKPGDPGMKDRMMKKAANTVPMALMMVWPFRPSFLDMMVAVAQV